MVEFSDLFDDEGVEFQKKAKVCNTHWQCALLSQQVHPYSMALIRLRFNSLTSTCTVR